MRGCFFLLCKIANFYNPLLFHLLFFLHFHFEATFSFTFFAQLDCNASSILCWWCLTTARAGLQGEVVPRALREFSLVSVNYNCTRSSFQKIACQDFVLGFKFWQWSCDHSQKDLFTFWSIYWSMYWFTLIRFSQLAEHLTHEWIVHYCSKLWPTNIKNLFSTKVRWKSGFLLNFCPAFCKLHRFAKHHPHIWLLFRIECNPSAPTVIAGLLFCFLSISPGRMADQVSNLFYEHLPWPLRQKAHWKGHISPCALYFHLYIWIPQVFWLDRSTVMAGLKPLEFLTWLHTDIGRCFK